MKKIIGYTDSIQECECCGKINLKGTYCLEIDGVELYYGSICAFKDHGLTLEEQRDLKGNFTKQQKMQKLIDLHITPLRKEFEEKMVVMGNIAFEIKILMKNYFREYVRVVKYKIAL